MAKMAMINRELKRSRLVNRYGSKRAKLREMTKDVSLSDEERRQARLKLNMMPRDSSPSRIRNRCKLT